MGEKYNRPRGSKSTNAPSAPFPQLNRDPFSQCMKCNVSLSGVTKLPKVIQDLSIILNCGHVLCNKCVHLNDSPDLNKNRPAHCKHDFKCSICGLMSPPLTIPTCVRICERKYTKVEEPEKCDCDICGITEKPRQCSSKLNNIAYCGIHSDEKNKFFCLQCGKHLCETCIESNPEDFESKEHVPVDMTKESLKVEDVILNGAHVHSNLGALEEEIGDQYKRFNRQCENLKNNMGCFFTALINVAIGRYCQINAAIQHEQDKVKDRIDSFAKNSSEAKRRFEVGKEMDDLARSRLLMPEDFVADSYRMSAQKIYRDGVGFHNEAIKDAKGSKNLFMQFRTSRDAKDVLDEIGSLFSNYECSTENGNEFMKIPKFTKLLQPSGQVAIDIPELHKDMKEIDFSTSWDAEIFRDNGLKRFQSALDICAITNMGKVHPSLIPSKIAPEDAVPSCSTFSPQKTPQIAKIGSTTESHSPTTSHEDNKETTDEKAKKQELLLQLIRGASAGDKSADECASNGPSTSKTVHHARKSAPFPLLNKDSSGVLSKEAADKLASMLKGNPTVANRLLQIANGSHQAGNSSQTSNKETNSSHPTVKHNSTKQSAAPLSKRSQLTMSQFLMSFVSNNPVFKRLSTSYKEFVLKQAHQIGIFEEKRRHELNSSEKDLVERLRVCKGKLSTLMNHLMNEPKNSERAKKLTAASGISKNPQQEIGRVQAEKNLIQQREMQRQQQIRNLQRNSEQQFQLEKNSMIPSSTAGLPQNQSHMLNYDQNNRYSNAVKEFAEKRAEQIKHEVKMRKMAEELAKKKSNEEEYEKRKKALENLVKQQEALSKDVLTRNTVVKMEPVDEINGKHIPEVIVVRSVKEEARSPVQNLDGMENVIHDQGRVSSEPPVDSPKVPGNFRRRLSEQPDAENNDTPMKKLQFNEPSTSNDEEAQENGHSDYEANGMSESPSCSNGKESPSCSNMIDSDGLEFDDSTSQSNTAPPILNGPNGRLILRIPRPKTNANLQIYNEDEYSSIRLSAPTHWESVLSETSNRDDSDVDSERNFDPDGSHAYCFVCNDELPELADSVKGICGSCPRSFHGVCTLPHRRADWGEEEQWYCIFCRQFPPKDEEKTELLTEYNRHLCRLVLTLCFSTRSGRLLLNSYVDVNVTLAKVGDRLELDAENQITTVPEFINAVNTVLQNASKYNPITSAKGMGTQAVWKRFRKAVRRYLPDYDHNVWLYLSLYNGNCNKRPATPQKKSQAKKIRRSR